jgi:foldase protein PrsA
MSVLARRPGWTAICLPIAAALMLVAAGCGSSVGAPKLRTGEVARVGSEPVTKARLEAVLMSAKASYKQQKKTFPKPGTAAYSALRQQVVAYLVQAAMLKQQAKDKLGIVIGKKDVQKAIAKLTKQSFGGSEKKLRAALKTQGLTRAELEAEEALALLEQRIQSKLVTGIKVTAAEIKAYYDSHHSSYRQAATRTVRHILVAKKSLADSLYAQLEKGADFAKLAKKYSTDTGSASKGGKLTISKGETVASFDKAAFSLAKGALSKPIHTTYGWHIIQALSAITPASTKPLAAVRSTIKQQLLQGKQSQAVTAWVAAATKRFCKGQVVYAKGYKPSSSSYDACATGTTTTSGSSSGS